MEKIMGDYADMMIDGDCCQVCGEYMGDAGDGYPRTCDGCLEEEQVTRKLYCCECKKKVEAVLVEGYEVYPHREDLWDKNFYQCECGCFVGCHPNSIKPLGCIANPELKKARQKIHTILDPLWKTKKYNRHELYGMISKEIGVKYHTANLRSIEEADKVYNFVLSLTTNK